MASLGTLALQPARWGGFSGRRTLFGLRIACAAARTGLSSLRIARAVLLVAMLFNFARRRMLEPLCRYPDAERSRAGIP